MLFGLIAAKFVATHVALGGLLMGIIGSVFLTKRFVICCIVILVGFSIGSLRGDQFVVMQQNITMQEDKKVTLRGVIVDDPVYGFRVMSEFVVSASSLEGHAVKGRFSVAGFIDDIDRGDKVTVHGKLRGRFGSREGYMSFADITVVRYDDSTIHSIRASFIASI